MKKYFLSIVALAGMLFATSCQESLVEPQVGGTTTFTVQVPDQMGTKADPTLGLAANVNQLFVAVYADASDADAAPIYRAVAQVSNGQATVKLNLIQDQFYDVIFWAQVDNNYVSAVKTDNEYTFDLVNIPMNKDYHNTDNGAAFFYYWDNFKPTGTSQPVTLRRPFAQLNLGTTEGSLTNNAGTFTLHSSVIKVKGIADNFNTVSGFGTVTEANKDIEYTFDAVALPSDETIKVAGVDYMYVSMDYLPIVGNDEACVDIHAEITLNNEDGPVVSHNFTNVPVRENYRTNIVGNLISSSTDFNVVVDADFAKDEDGQLYPDNDILVVENAAAAQLALDNAKPGDVISLAAGVNYGTLKIRAVEGKAHTTSVDYFTTKYTKELLRKVENLTIIGAPGAKVDAIQMVSTYNTENDKICYFIDVQNLVIDGIEFTDKAKQSEAFCSPLDIKLKCINVNGLTLKNCKLNGSRDNMFLLYFFNQQDSQSQFATAAKNITISGNTVSGIAGLCELREAENVTISDNIINDTYNNPIKLACNSGKAYSGNVNIIGNNADMVRGAFVVIGDAGDADVVITNNTITNYFGTDPTNFIKIYSSNKVAVIENNILINRLVASAAELQTAIDGATGNYVIALGADIEGDVAIDQKDGIHLVIDGLGHKYNGQIKIIEGDVIHNIGAASLQLNNINFETEKAQCYFIWATNDKQSNEYLSNITISDCTFTGLSQGSKVYAFVTDKAVGRVNDNIIIENCKANGIETFLSGYTKTVTLKNVESYSANGGVNLQTSFSQLTIENCKFITNNDADGYAVRVAGGLEGSMTVRDSKLEAYNPIKVRHLTDKFITVEFEGTQNELILKDQSQLYQIYIEGNTDFVKINGGDNFTSNKQ